MRRIVIGVALAAISIFLVACGTTDEPVPDVPIEDTSTSGATFVTVDKPGGGSVDCVVYQGYLEGSITCDWNEETP